MAQKSGGERSVAPRERVHIVYKTYKGDVEEEVELPFRYLVVGDFTGRADSSPVEERQPISVDKDNFDEVLAAQDVRLTACVPNRLTGREGDELTVELAFGSMKDFSPDSICAQVPELRTLVELRDALTVLKGPLGDVPAFRKRLRNIIDNPEAQKQLLAELNLFLERGKAKR